MKISSLLEIAAETMPQRIAVGSVDGGITYEELFARARRTALELSASGAERVGFVGLNSPAVPILLFASALAGVPFVPVNYRLADDRLVGLMERLSPALVVADTPNVERIEAVGAITIRTTDEMLDAVAPPDDRSGLRLSGDEADDTAIWLFTSGTTGSPKVAVLRHEHLSSYILSTVELMSADPDEATLVSVPSYHIAGLAAVLSATFSGRRVVYLPQFDAAEWVGVVDRERISHAMVVPTMLGRLLDAVEEGGTRLESLRSLSYGGGRMPAATIERAMDLLPGVGFVNAYGLTETSSTIAVLGPEDHREARASDDPAVRARLGSVGRTLPSLELRVVDSSGTELAAGSPGEIWVRGPQISGEYVAGSVLDESGWFHTNDEGYLDDDGFLFVNGRLDDVIVRGGENLSPGEIEDVLRTHPAVADAGVVGVPDEEWGEVPAAAVVLHDGVIADEDELRAWVAGRLRSSRTPALISTHGSLPYNETGKLLRRVLRQQLATTTES